MGMAFESLRETVLRRELAALRSLQADAARYQAAELAYRLRLTARRINGQKADRAAGALRRTAELARRQLFRTLARMKAAGIVNDVAAPAAVDGKTLAAGGA